MITALTLENMMESKDSCVFSRFNLSKVIFSTMSKGSIKVLAVEKSLIGLIDSSAVLISLTL